LIFQRQILHVTTQFINLQSQNWSKLFSFHHLTSHGSFKDNRKWKIPNLRRGLLWFPISNASKTTCTYPLIQGRECRFILLGSFPVGLLTGASGLSRDDKMGWARRAGPPARQKKHGPSQEIQPANPIQPDPSSPLAHRANPWAKTGQPAARTS